MQIATCSSGPCVLCRHVREGLRDRGGPRQTLASRWPPTLGCSHVDEEVGDTRLLQTFPILNAGSVQEILFPLEGGEFTGLLREGPGAGALWGDKHYRSTFQEKVCSRPTRKYH